MTHSYPHTEFGEGLGGSSLDTSCEECLNKIVGHLDDHNFYLLMGCTRQEFEGWCRLSYGGDSTIAGLYNFFEGIMSLNAIKVFARRDDLAHRLARSGSV